MLYILYIGFRSRSAVRWRVKTFVGVPEISRRPVTNALRRQPYLYSDVDP